MRHFLASAAAAAAAAVLLVLAGCGQHPAEIVSPFRPTTSFQDIMASVVDPAVDQIWDAVSTEISKAGVEEKRPQTDEEWLALRQRAISLAEAANLLVIEGRPLVAPGKALDNKDGYLNPEEIQKAINASRPSFISRAHDFQDAATQALTAIDAKNAGALIEAGAHLQVACEQCHLIYWYPNGGPPRLPPRDNQQHAANAR
jgi:hypothetical protein